MQWKVHITVHVVFLPEMSPGPNPKEILLHVECGKFYGTCSHSLLKNPVPWTSEYENGVFIMHNRSQLDPGFKNTHYKEHFGDNLENLTMDLWGNGKFYFLSSGSFWWQNHQINKREIDKRKSNLISRAWKPHVRIREMTYMRCSETGKDNGCIWHSELGTR